MGKKANDMAKQRWCAEGLCLCNQQGEPLESRGRHLGQAALQNLGSTTPRNPYLCPCQASSYQQPWPTALQEDWGLMPHY